MERSDVQLWEQGPRLPPPPAEKVSRDCSCFGMLGMALQDALQELQTESCEDCPAAALNVTPGVLDRIMQSLGEEVAITQQNPPVDAPAALLRGRLEHYNRLNKKWRLVVKDAELRQRNPLEGNRRKRERPSLWQVAEEQRQAKPDQDSSGVSKSINLEILAYNDID
jgi:hypothetical protein